MELWKNLQLKKGNIHSKKQPAPDGYLVSTEITFEVVYNQDKNALEIENVKTSNDNKYENGVFVMVDDYKKPDTPGTPLKPGKKNLKVEKEWKSIDPKDAPEVTIYLVKNGVRTDKFVKLNKDNKWKGEFKDLAVVDDIKDAKSNEYTVEWRWSTGRKSKLGWKDIRG